MSKARKKFSRDKSFWSARMGLGEWIPEDKREIELRAAEVLAARMGCTVEEAFERRKVLARVPV